MCEFTCHPDGLFSLTENLNGIINTPFRLLLRNTNQPSPLSLTNVGHVKKFYPWCTLKHLSVPTGSKNLLPILHWGQQSAVHELVSVSFIRSRQDNSHAR